jgi:predicted HicB family RNase H-like nuclease
MRNILKYKGYTGSVDFDAEDKIFHGKVLGITDIITFEGKTVTGLEKDFHAAVIDYLKTCHEIEKEPEKPYSGKFNVRIPSELHNMIAQKAKNRGISLNTWVIDTFKKIVSAET